MSTDLDDLMRRDDDLYDMAGARERAEREEPRRPTVVGMLDRIAEVVPKPGETAAEETASDAPAADGAVDSEEPADREASEQEVG